MKSSVLISKHCLVSGKVQGVFFRRYTQQKAKELQLTGWVRNLADGCVEIVVSGDAQVIDEFCKWLYIGSPQSAVSEVIVEDINYIMHDDFIVR